MLKRTSLAIKIGMINLILIVSFVIFMFFWVYPKFKENVYNLANLKTKHLTETAWGVLDYYNRQAENGKMTLGEAQKKALATIEGLRYEQNDYFWINDMYPRMIMHPMKPELNGTDLSDYKDPNGKRLFVEFVEVAKAKGAGHVDYYWPKPGQTKPVPKISYVKLFPAWGWIIGTGVYLEDVQKQVAASRMLNISMIAILIIVILSISSSFLMTRSITTPLQIAIKNLNEGALQVASASNQLFGSSQQLAEGNSEQAASLEETSATLEESAAIVTQNSENTKQAALMTSQTNAAAEKCNEEMQNMMRAMAEIKKSSDEISKIIKVIDEIAFQTNILALNAAVEAARAGDAGMGFAVVAEEVRNLAQRSAQAAKDTAAIIERNIELSEHGVDMAERVKNALAEITNQARKVNQLIDEIAASSREQADGIIQIKNAITQIGKVTEQNAANAQQNAASAEELNAQAESMKEVMQELIKLVNGMKGKSVKYPQSARLPVKPQMAEMEPSKPSGHAGYKLATGNGLKRTALVKPEDVISLEDDMKDF